MTCLISIMALKFSSKTENILYIFWLWVYLVITYFRSFFHISFQQPLFLSSFVTHTSLWIPPKLT
jgi:hypothetical protein